MEGSQVPEYVLQFVALQLLASCFTLSAASTADSLPLSQQRKGAEIMTSLRMHSQYRFSPAAGHHARPPSETSSWPGLYTGPSIEDTLADVASQARRSATCSRTHAGAWSDGPAPSQRFSSSSSSSSESSACASNVFSKWLCHPSPKRTKHRSSQTHPRPALRTYTSVPSQTISSRSSPGTAARRLSRNISQVTQRFGLRHIRSASPIQAHPLDNRVLNVRRSSSTPAFGNAHGNHFDIPEIWLVSASTAGWSRQNMHSTGYLDSPLDESRLRPLETLTPDRFHPPSSELASTRIVIPSVDPQSSGYLWKAGNEPSEDHKRTALATKKTHVTDQAEGRYSEDESEESCHALDKRKAVILDPECIRPQLEESLRKQSSTAHCKKAAGAVRRSSTG
ncbi:hypothetical protein EJ04DRAFT_556388 [Polyplosphaeria fusca]|uniref:Uncharacterized protein n=1 Tax=Polyplosphaeria fusca TaxID=682080 RepID=A0A9P4UW79_9PLEO|nr:hypothetical protein EJ04DRAFT_556388 [Polyplosphaeria fusca]